MSEALKAAREIVDACAGENRPSPAWAAKVRDQIDDALTAGEPDFAESIAAVIKEESEGGAAAGWRSCTGCHETNEGYETGRYPYSKMFGCHVGSGCSECGGIGVTWEYWSKDALTAMAEDNSTALTAGEQEPVAWPCSLGVGDGDGKLFVHGDYDSIKAAQAIIFQAGEATSELEALRKRVAELEAEIEEHLNARSAEMEVAFDDGHYRAMSEHATPWQRRAETAEARVAELEKALNRAENTACRGLDEGDTRDALIDIKFDLRTARRVREGGKAE